MGRPNYIPRYIDAGMLLAFVGTAIFFCLPLGTTPPLLFGMIAVCAWLFSGMPFREYRIYAEPRFWPVYVYIAMIWLGLAYSTDTHGLGLGYAKKTHYWLYGLALAAAPFVRFPAERFVHAFLAGLGLNFLVALIQVAGLLPADRLGYFGLSSGYTELSAYLIIAMMVLSLMIGKATEPKRKYGLAVLWLAFFIHLTLLNSRTGYVGFVLLLPFMAANLFVRANLFKLAGFTLVAVCLMMLSPVVQKRVALSIDQIQYHMSVDDEQAWGREYTAHQDRFYMWYHALHIFKEHPFIGVGTGAYRTELEKFGGPDVPGIAHPHNNILYVIVSYGVCGLIVFVWLFGMVIAQGWRHRRTVPGSFVLATALCILVTGIFNTQLLNAGTAFILSLAVGMQRSLDVADSETESSGTEPEEAA